MFHDLVITHEKIRFHLIPKFTAVQSKKKFNPEYPDTVWVSDITYIWTFEGFVYLTSIMDLYSRKIIAWELSNTLEAIHGIILE